MRPNNADKLEAMYDTAHVLHHIHMSHSMVATNTAANTVLPPHAFIDFSPHINNADFVIFSIKSFSWFFFVWFDFVAFKVTNAI